MTIITGLKNPPTLLMADQNQSLLKKLPKDVLLKLLSFLPIQSIEMFSQTCQSFNVVLQNNHFWWSLFNSRMPAPIPEGTCYEVEFYKSALKNQYLLLNGGYTSQLIEGIIYSVIVADGKLIMGNRDGTITIRDLKSLEWIGTLTGHTEAVSTLFWDDNNKKLISSSEDRTIKFW
ncbi:MAG TPA: F-box-like domain-containing protein, partial [Rhabdochlamydiaceae bacterium]